MFHQYGTKLKYSMKPNHMWLMSQPNPCEMQECCQFIFLDDYTLTNGKSAKKKFFIVEIFKKRCFFVYLVNLMDFLTLYFNEAPFLSQLSYEIDMYLFRKLRIMKIEIWKRKRWNFSKKGIICFCKTVKNFQLKTTILKLYVTTLIICFFYWYTNWIFFVGWT